MGTKSGNTNISRTLYGNTTTSNPYAYSKSTDNGTVSGFKNGTALQSVYDFVNRGINDLLEDYMRPNLNTATNQAKLNSFANTLAQQTKTNFENNIINPLSNRNMIRSSQANDLYKNLTNQNVSAVSDFTNNLISNSQKDTADMLNNLLSYYMLGANYLSAMQNHSLKASSGNATRYNTSENSNGGALQDLAPLLISAILAGAI